MGTDPGQPLTLICDFEKSKFYIVSIDVRPLDTVEIKADLDWAMLVAFHRGRMDKIKDTDFYNKYSNMPGRANNAPSQPLFCICVK